MMLGTVPVFLFLGALMIALFSFISMVVWSTARRREREAYYKSELLKKIAEQQGAGATAALEYLREQEQNAGRRRIEGMKLGGLIIVAVGAATMILLRQLIPDEPLYLEGLIPSFVGLVLLAYAYLMAPKH